MSAVEERIDVNALVPDGIEPVEALRAWNFDGKVLSSLTNGTVWTPGEPVCATCTNGNGDVYSWGIVRNGLSREKAKELFHNQWQQRYFSFSYVQRPSFVPAVPSIEPPDGYGFHLDKHAHSAPEESCSCGIYAVSNEPEIPSGQVYGKVKMWGKVIPGEKGFRAEFAYPSELHVPANLADNPALKAFGVPIIVRDDLPSGQHSIFTVPSYSGMIYTEPPRSRMHRVLRFSIACNIAAATFNLLLSFRVIRL